MPIMRCPTVSGTVAPCFSASARNCAPISRWTLALKRNEVGDGDPIKDREQQQRIFGRLSQRFSLLDQQACLLLSRLGFLRARSLYMEERGYEPGLKLDLFATQRR